MPLRVCDTPVAMPTPTAVTATAAQPGSAAIAAAHTHRPIQYFACCATPHYDDGIAGRRDRLSARNDFARLPTAAGQVVCDELRRYGREFERCVISLPS